MRATGLHSTGTISLQAGILEEEGNYQRR